MEFQKAKRIFFNWLKSKGVYEAYKLARHNNNHLVGEERRTCGYYRHPLAPTQFVKHAFTWRTTREGYDFWDEINYQWRKHLLEIETDSRYQ